MSKHNLEHCYESKKYTLEKRKINIVAKLMRSLLRTESKINKPNLNQERIELYCVLNEILP